MKNTIKQEAKRQLRIELGLLDKTQMLENAEIEEMKMTTLWNISIN